MVRSMTGFGGGEVRGETVTVTVEARAVNSRHLDVALRLPRALSSFEPEARRLVQGRLERGRVEVTVQLAQAAGTAAGRVVVDEALARDYLAHARRLAEDLGLAPDVSPGWLLERPGVVRMEDAEPAGTEILLAAVTEAIGRALDDLIARREAEGARLAAELRVHLTELGATVDRIAERAPVAVRRREERLRERLAALLGEGVVDEQRLLTEVAVWADRADVSEEVVRLRAHLGEFRLLLDKGGPVGRALDFLIQELNREVNTVGSKADDLELSQAALGAKGILEKMREQVQNLE